MERQNRLDRGISAKVSQMTDRPLRVSLVVFPESDPSVIFGLFDTLWASGRFWNAMQGTAAAPHFEPRLVGAKAGPLELVTGVTVTLQNGIDDIDETDIVILPNVVVFTGEDLRGLDRRLLDWIRQRHEAGAHVYATCAGTLALAEAGLLDGLEATTHWGYAALFRREFPGVTLHADRILVQTGSGQRIVCSGGASSWQDMVLYMIAKHVGAEEAIRLSKIFLYQWHKENQLAYACMIQNVGHEDAIVHDCQAWIAQNYDKPNVVGELVRRSGLPERSFNRRFKAATGYSPLAYVQAMRIEEAKQALETSDLGVDKIGREVGYEDSASFRRLFKRITGMTPAAYRRSFRVPRERLPMGSGNAAPVTRGVQSV